MPKQKKTDLKKHILLVEDEPLLIDLYSEYFGDSPDFTITVAKNGNEGLEKAQDGADLILLDILLPELNGFEVLKRLKASNSTKDIPVIVFTNLGSETSDKDKQLALSLGAEDYLVKSYHTPEELGNIIKEKLRVK